MDAGLCPAVAATAPQAPSAPAAAVPVDVDLLEVRETGVGRYGRSAFAAEAVRAGQARRRPSRLGPRARGLRRGGAHAQTSGRLGSVAGAFWLFWCVYVCGICSG
ncbi:unnamed protein product [Prorocentrum cordatum]|uniref:Uncharacterized protein n=1 Tax=Prorocentrum cordatum TaxID=2364126 RepID=A0ABN9QGJ7_9DINO|nr:unnamed protein product [Polarella glacialis]